MAEFHDTAGIGFRLRELIKNAKTQLILISPYLRINELLRQLLEDQDRARIDIRVVYGKNELHPDENNWLRERKFIRTSYYGNLHAKCFMNESEALLTSMNLYEFSQVNNAEMGIYVRREEDPTLYDAMYQEAMRLIRFSDEIQVEVKKVSKKSSSASDSHKPKDATVPLSGFCIRCKAELEADPTHPYCTDCYRVWKQYENPEYEEEFCHTCGNPNKSTIDKPTCYSCYRKYKNVLAFPLA